MPDEFSWEWNCLSVASRWTRHLCDASLRLRTCFSPADLSGESSWFWWHYFKTKPDPFKVVSSWRIFPLVSVVAPCLGHALWQLLHEEAPSFPNGEHLPLFCLFVSPGHGCVFVQESPVPSTASRLGLNKNILNNKWREKERESEFCHKGNGARNCCNGQRNCTTTCTATNPTPQALHSAMDADLESAVEHCIRATMEIQAVCPYG